MQPHDKYGYWCQFSELYRKTTGNIELTCWWFSFGVIVEGTQPFTASVKLSVLADKHRPDGY
jgi:hypothetical protein